MKIIKIFLASSVVEFKKERQELAAFVNSLNNIFVRKDIFVEITICEELSNAVAMERKQNEYNGAIRESDYLIMLFGKSAGEFTIEEFDVALEQFRVAGAPKIYIYFKRMPEGESVEKSIVDFKARLEQLGLDYGMFDYLDSIKRNLMLILSQDPKVDGVIEFSKEQ